MKRCECVWPDSIDPNYDQHFYYSKEEQGSIAYVCEAHTAETLYLELYKTHITAQNTPTYDLFLRTALCQSTENRSYYRNFDANICRLGEKGNQSRCFIPDFDGRFANLSMGTFS